eukprot:gene23318-biopygen7363
MAKALQATNTSTVLLAPIVLPDAKSSVSVAASTALTASSVVVSIVSYSSQLLSTVAGGGSPTAANTTSGGSSATLVGTPIVSSDVLNIQVSRANGTKTSVPAFVANLTLDQAVAGSSSDLNVVLEHECVVGKREARSVYCRLSGVSMNLTCNGQAAALVRRSCPVPQRVCSVLSLSDWSVASNDYCRATMVGSSVLCKCGFEETGNQSSTANTKLEAVLSSGSVNVAVMTQFVAGGFGGSVYGAGVSQAALARQSTAVFSTFGGLLFMGFCVLCFLMVSDLMDQRTRILLDTIQILTEVTTSCLLLALLFDLQYPSDDGSCAAHKAEEACLLRRTPLESSQSYCTWNAATPPSAGFVSEYRGGKALRTVSLEATVFGTDAVSYCTYNDSPRSINVTILAVLVVNVVSIPVALLLSQLMSLIRSRRMQELIHRQQIQAAAAVQALHEPQKAAVEEAAGTGASVMAYSTDVARYVAIFIVLAMNIASLYFIVLKGAFRGLDWQWRYLSVCLLNWVSEVVFLRVWEIWARHFYLPSGIESDVVRMLAVLSETAALWVQNRGRAVSGRSAAAAVADDDGEKVSVQLARQRQATLESQLVGLWVTHRRAFMSRSASLREEGWTSVGLGERMGPAPVDAARRTRRRYHKSRWVDRLMKLPPLWQSVVVRGVGTSSLGALIFLWYVVRGRREILSTSALLIALVAAAVAVAALRAHFDRERWQIVVRDREMMQRQDQSLSTAVPSTLPVVQWPATPNEPQPPSVAALETTKPPKETRHKSKHRDAAAPAATAATADD